MKPRHKSCDPLSAFPTIALSALFLLAASFCLPVPARSDEPPADTVGAIEGDAIVVSGPMNVEIVHGQSKTVLRSGSDVRVKSGKARIDLVEGGDIVICGPAHFSVLKSAGALTIALDSGIIHAHITREPALTIYTAQIQAKSVAIGDGPLDILVGFDAAGAMCIHAASGAVRLEQQLSGQTVMVPQGGDVLVANGQLDAIRTTSGHCSCELQVASGLPPPVLPPAPSQASPPTTPEVSVLASTEETPKKQSEANPQPQQPAEQKPAAAQEPIYQVFMPPLAYDAKAKVQPDYDPKFIVLVRRARVRPGLIFQGRVEGDPVVVASNAAPAGPQIHPQAAPKPAAQNADDSLLGRVRSFWHRLWARNS